MLDLRGKCVHVLDDLTSVDIFLQFGSWSGTQETALGLGVDAALTALGQRFKWLVFHAGSKKGKREFTATTITIE